MTNQELLQAVYARLGGKPDMAPEPLILAKVQDAIKSLSKELVYSGNPMSTLLVKTVEKPLEVDAEGSGFFVADLSDFEVIKTGDKLKSVFMKVVGDLNLDLGTFTVSNQLLIDLGGFVNPAWQTIDFGTFNNPSVLRNRKIIQPTNSWDALETLPWAHNKSYYKYHNNKLYISLGIYDKVRKYYAEEESVGGESVIEIEHFCYLPLSEFPYELVDVLLNALVPMLMPQAPQQEPKKNEGKKKR
jgi:hypothetical protein